MLKKLLFAFLLAAFITDAPAAPAEMQVSDEVALMKIRVGKRKEEYAVAIELFEPAAPQTVANFKKLVKKKFYDGILFHRAFPDTLVQVGDPLTRDKDRTRFGTGGPGYTLFPEIRLKHTRGAVAMARLPDKINPARMSNGSQFYVCLKPLPEYDGQYTVFGKVLYGMEVLEAISKQPTDSNDFPTERIKIHTMRLLPHAKLPPPTLPAAANQKPAKKPWYKFW